jgi:hypothetical protein
MTNTPEITPETLQNISFEIIAKLLTIWRDPKKAVQGFTFKSPREQAAWKFRQGEKLHDMVIDALRYNRDIAELAKIVKAFDLIRSEYELARKSGLLPRGLPPAP